MGRYIDMPEEIIDELRQIYRKTNSLVAVLRYVECHGLDKMYVSRNVVTMEVFGLPAGDTQWVRYWNELPVPGEFTLTAEELDAKMRPLIEKNRHLWDKLTEDSDPPK